MERRDDVIKLVNSKIDFLKSHINARFEDLENEIREIRNDIRELRNFYLSYNGKVEGKIRNYFYIYFMATLVIVSIAGLLLKFFR